MAQLGIDTHGRPEVLDTPVVDDNGSQTVKQILAKQDEIITQLKALTAKMDADFADVSNASVDYAAVITDGIDKVKFIG